MIHHLEPGSDAEGADLAPYDVLVSVDGESVDSLERLESIARNAAALKRPLELMFLRFAVQGQNELFLHHRRTLLTSEVEVVGPATTSVAKGGR